MASSYRLKVLGCGDAFGSGGVPNSSFFLETPEEGILIDCGASTLVQLKKYGLSSDDIDRILISHFHGDHYGGIPFILLEAALVQQRERPLSIVGPEGIREKLVALQDALYPGTSQHMDRLDLHFSSFSGKSSLDFDGMSLHTRPVLHAEGSSPHAMRIELGGRVIAYSGDTSWTDELYPVADEADLFICECNFLKGDVPGHIHYEELKEKAPHIGAQRIVLTHRGPDMLANEASVEHECLVEGQEIEL
jgi:ribonuclease BN (tRNA processing enzyme)